MRLTNESLKNTAFWEKAGINLPKFDRNAMITATKTAPKWLHFGAGNIFRAFPAALAQSLLEQGLEKSGIVVAVRYNRETINACFAKYDNLNLLVTLKSDGSTDKKVIASVASYIGMDCDREELNNIFANPSLQMVSFTITEKGYNLTGKDGVFLPDIAEDLCAGPESAKSFAGRVAALCYERFKRGAHPLALVSMDNCSHNGDRLFTIAETFAKSWIKKGKTNPGFLDYVRSPKKLTFPWTMIDKITPGPDSGVRETLTGLGLEDMESASAVKSTPIAPFVNAEEKEYLVMENAFPNGRPVLEKTGVLFADRETVEKVEKMKVGTCLNPIHTALAVYGCLLGFTRMNKTIKDPDLAKLVKGIGYIEGLPVVVNPGIIDPKTFIDEVINVRIPNPFLPDSPQRIATDTSQKIPVRFGGTLKALKESGRKLGELKYIPLVFSGWLRYLLGVDDEGNGFEPSPDPLLESLKTSLAGIVLGETNPGLIRSKLAPILANPSLFGINLVEAGMDKQVLDCFTRLIAGPGAVRKVLSAL